MLKNIKINKIICLLLCFFVLFFAFTPAQEAEAIPIAIPFIGIGILGTLLVAAGLTFSDSDSITDAATDLFHRVEDVRDFVDDYESHLAGGLLTLTTSVWLGVTSYVHSNYQVGSNVIVSEPQYLFNGMEIINLSPPALGTSVGDYPEELIIPAIYPSGSFPELEWNYEVPNARNFSFFYDRSTYDGFRYCYLSKATGNEFDLNYTLDEGFIPIVFAYLYEVLEDSFSVRIGVRFKRAETGVMRQNRLVNYGFFEKEDFGEYGEIHSCPLSISATGQDVVGVENYDFIDEGQRSIPFSDTTTVDDLVDLTFSDVQNVAEFPDVGDIPDDSPMLPPFPDAWDGVWGDGVPGSLEDWTFDSPGIEIDYETAGEWTGEWTQTLDGTWVWDGTLTDSLSVTYPVTATATPSWAYQDWTVPPAISTKFPFSIPWDLKFAIESLVATPEAPVWEINFPSEFFVGGGQIVIDFSIFETWAKIIRWGVLIGFNVFLILTTRKVIGA